MSTVAVIRGPKGEAVAMAHGALIGRLWTADLHINDPRVSEAHAMVSVRGRDVHLLALRGRFAVGGQWRSDVVLSVGQRLSLAPGVEVEVVEVRVPDRVFALEADGLSRQVPSGVTSLYGGAWPRLVAGWQANAECHVWPDGDVWMRDAAAPVPILEDDTWEVGGALFRAVWQQVEGAARTVSDPSYARPVRIVVRWDTVHLNRTGEPPVVISGHMARAISQLATAGAAMSWEDLAHLRWRDGDRHLLRHRWDMQMRRLRLKLGASGLRTDLLRPDGTGLIELVLGPGDVVVDET